MTLRPSAPSRGRSFPLRLRLLGAAIRSLWLLCLGAGGHAHAHNPVSSRAHVQAFPDRVELKVEMATESAWLFLTGSLDTAPDVAGSLPQLREKAPEVYRLSVGDKVLRPRAAEVGYTDDDGIEFRLVFDRPADGPVRFEARYLARLTPDHRATLTLLDASGRTVRGELVNLARPAVELALPSAVPAPAPSAAPSPPTVSARAFFALGVEHILTGYDHLLFLLGLLVVCRSVAKGLAIVTCFTAAHSVTLALAACNVVLLPARVVEPLIAASIVFVGAENLLRRGERERRWLLPLAFGLIHGFGFAGALRAAGLGSGGASLALPLVSFNLGVEAGQLAVLAVVLPVLWLLQRRPAFVRYGMPAVSAIVVLLGAHWLWQRLLGA